jgi:hypothetical protein
MSGASARTLAIGGCWCAALFVMARAPAHADPRTVVDEELMAAYAGLSTSFAVSYMDLFIKKRDNDWANFADGFRGSIAVATPLQPGGEKPKPGNGVREATGKSPTIRSTITYNPMTYWFGSVTLTGYYDYDYQADWNGDFSYLFGYDDWHPYTLGFYYSNYGGNRLFPKRGETLTKFLEGTFNLVWKVPMPKFISEPVLIEKEAIIGCQAGYHLTPQYFDLGELGNKDVKHKLSFGCKYPIIGNWYFTAAAYAYPVPGQQQPWDADYTYGFGYFDWKSGAVSVQYNNYSGNRFPWREQPTDTGKFMSGEVSVSWSWAM